MAVIPVKPFVLKDCKLTISTTGAVPTEVGDFEAHVSQVQFTPSTQTQTWQGLTPTASFTDQSATTWAAALAYAQDWETPNSLSRYLHEHEGDKVTAVFEPKAGGPAVTAVLIITAGAIGGTVNQFATSTVTLGVDGRPTIAAA